MKKRGKKEPITIDFWSVIKQRFHLLKIGIIPLIIFFIGIYLLIKTSQSQYMSSQDMMWNTIGLIMGLVGAISLIIIFVISGVRTFKKWEIVKKQKSYLRKQQTPHTYRAIFFILIIVIFAGVYQTGIEGFEEISNVFDWIIIIAIIWSIIVFIKNNMSKKK